MDNSLVFDKEFLQACFGLLYTEPLLSFIFDSFFEYSSVNMVLGMVVSCRWFFAELITLSYYITQKKQPAKDWQSLEQIKEIINNRYEVMCNRLCFWL